MCSRVIEEKSSISVFELKLLLAVPHLVSAQACGIQGNKEIKEKNHQKNYLHLSLYDSCQICLFNVPPEIHFRTSSLLKHVEAL